MGLGTPIKLTLYNDQDEEIQTYSRARIPLVFAERAIEFSSSLGEGDLNQDQLNALYQLIVDFFGGQFDIAQLRAGADLGEMITVIEGIASRVAELMPASANPTRPGKARAMKV